MEYTFKDWLDGKPEPDNKYWFLGRSNQLSNIPEPDPVYLKIRRAKNFAFDKALDFTLDAMKYHFINKVKGLTEFKKTLYIQKAITESEKHFIDYDIRNLIDQSHPSKFKGIDGGKYKTVKDQYEGLKEGRHKRCKINLNDFFFAVLHFEMTEFLNGDFSELPKDPEKGEPLAVRYHLLILLGLESITEFRTLPPGKQINLLKYIFACNSRTAKGLKNGELKYINANHEARAKELISKIKKGDIL